MTKFEPKEDLMGKTKRQLIAIITALKVQILQFEEEIQKLIAHAKTK